MKISRVLNRNSAEKFFCLVCLFGLTGIHLYTTKWRASNFSHWRWICLIAGELRTLLWTVHRGKPEVHPQVPRATSRQDLVHLRDSRDRVSASLFGRRNLAFPLPFSEREFHFVFFRTGFSFTFCRMFSPFVCVIRLVRGILTTWGEH